MKDKAAGIEEVSQARSEARPCGCVLTKTFTHRTVHCLTKCRQPTLTEHQLRVRQSLKHLPGINTHNLQSNLGGRYYLLPPFNKGMRQRYSKERTALAPANR